MASVFRAGTIFFSALVFAGCGGGGDTSPPIPDAPVGGIWSGTVDIQGQGVVELVGLVTEEGRGHFIQEDGIQYWGTVSASARNLTGTVSGAPPFGTTFPDGSVSATGTITGIIVPQVNVARAAVEATVHRPAAVFVEHHEGVVLLFLEIPAIQIQSRLVAIRPS